MEEQSIRLDGDTPDVYQLMMEVVKEMKEIPELPSEKPKDVSHLVKVAFPNTGGMLTEISGHALPYRGFPYFEMVEKIDLIKKVIRSTLSSFFHSIKKRNKVQLLTIALVPWFLADAVKAGIYTFYRIVERFKLKTIRYSDAMRELHRALSIEFPNESYDDRELRFQLRDLICMILEFDNAYRYRFQDVVVELNKSALRKNPGKELARLLSVMQSRETGQTVKDTWTLFKTFLPAIFLLNPKVKKQVIAVIEELDLTKVALSLEDKWYAAGRKDYICAYRKHPNPEEQKLIEQFAIKTKRDALKESIRNASTHEHEALFKRQAAEIGISDEVRKQIVDDELALQKAINEEAARQYDMRKKGSIANRLTPEQVAIMERHLKEIEEMDKLYNKKLVDVDKEYGI